MKMITFNILFVALLFFSFFNVQAQTIYYIGPAGNNANPGTDPLNPWKTIQWAFDHATAGSTVNIEAGIYSEKVTLGVSGTVSGVITFQNNGNDVVVLDGTGINTQDEMIYINNKSYVKIIGLELRNNKGSGTPVGIRVEGFGTDITIKNCKIHNIETTDRTNGNAHGLGVWGTNGTNSYSNVIADGNEIYNCFLGNSESLVFNGNVTGFQIINNIVHDNDNIAIDMIGFEGTAPANDQARNGICKGNTVYNISSGTNPAYGGDYSADGIYVDGGKDIVIENNLSYNCDIGIEVASEWPGKITENIIVRNNLVHSSNTAGIATGGYDTGRGWSMNCQFLNNTLYNNNTLKDGNGEFMIQKCHNNTFKNNIVYCNSQNLVMSNYFSNTYSYSNTFNYNLYYCMAGANNLEFVWENNSYTGMTSYKTASGQDANSMTTDPKFVSITLPSPDLHLQSNSPAINAGDPAFVAASGEVDIDAESRVLGGAVDIGADENNTQLTALHFSGADSFGLEIFPNPCHDLLRLSGNKADITNLKISILSLNGTEIISGSFGEANAKFEIAIDLSELKPSVYFVRIFSEQRVWFGKIIKE